jgi:hypothetical protein
VLAVAPAQACIYICRCMKHARNHYLQDGRPYVSYYDGRGRIVRKLDDVERVRSFLEQDKLHTVQCLFTCVIFTVHEHDPVQECSERAEERNG